MTGKERRWLDPRRGALKLTERTVDRLVSRYLFPNLLGVWHPYCWLLPRRFQVAEAEISPPLWPREADGLRLLLVSDVHTGAFLKPEVLDALFAELMCLEPDLVAVAGDMVEGSLSDLDGFLPALGRLASAPLGAWFCFGNHDYYSREPEAIRDQLASAGIVTLRNESVRVRHRGRAFAVGGVDDRILGTPDWDALVAEGTPHLVLAHNPDDFYEAARAVSPRRLRSHARRTDPPSPRPPDRPPERILPRRGALRPRGIPPRRVPRCR